MPPYLFLKEDYVALQQQIEEKKQLIRSLGTEKGEAARQSTENFGHDDAVQEVLVHDIRIATKQLEGLMNLSKNASIVQLLTNQDGVVHVGSMVDLSDGRKFRISSYHVFVTSRDDYTNISYNSPLGRKLIQSEIGDTVTFQDHEFTITKVS